MEVYYYTGDADQVPHIPDVCAKAGGQDITSTDVLAIDIPGAADERWRHMEVNCVRTDGREPAQLRQSG